MPRVEDVVFPRRERTEDRRKERWHRDVLDEVFDRPTLLAVSRMVSSGHFSEVDFSVSTGKEANVFRVSGPKGFRALKVYRISNSIFRNLPPWALAEIRREVGGGSFPRMVAAWAHREFTSLGRCHDAGVPVPEPMAQFRNLLLMEFVGVEGLPSPPLVKAVIEEPETLRREIAQASRTMVEKAKLVHGDLSPFNVLYHRDHAVLIDVGQVLRADHPQAKEMLRRDAATFARYFSRQGVECAPETLYAEMGGDLLP
ncbi:MAG: serine protein kinase RIO [Euryarchaeota archaeon]|nr:serine protein kinase RIO [Euryarchaeota archaeon]MDE1835177.1 serine protein kinase RIO [Euryarchaeota archaeon]MDE1880412.1 serine protein kinase RIO [Euryarchaeota archaeon]MDE2045719.1 serine protein kinase RIO [Thermoplasmata archaeon]